MDEEDTDSIPVKDVNENNSVKKPRSTGGAANADAPAGVKRPLKARKEHESGKKKLASVPEMGGLPAERSIGDAQPVRTGLSGSSKPTVADIAEGTNLIRVRQDVARWDRDVLEDKYLRLLDAEILLKRHCRKQEERIKKMSVKLIRLAADRKSSASTAVRRVGTADGAVVSETLAELEAQVKKLEKEKQQMEERYTLMIEQMQLTAAAANHRSSQAYETVPPRIDTGMKRDARVAKGLRVFGPRSNADPLASQRSSLPPPAPSQKLPRYGHSLLEDAREQIQYMESIIEQQNEQIRICEQDNEDLKEEMRQKEIGFEEDLLRIKQEATGVTRTSLQENVDLIRLQREVKDKASRILVVQAQYDSLESNMRSLKDSHGVLLKEMEVLNSQLIAERSKNVSLQNQIKRNPSDVARIKELEESLNDSKNEICILKEANEKLVTSAFDMEREREWRKRENALKVQIAQLEATLKADLGEKGSVLDRLTAEREAADRRENEYRQLQKEYFKVKEQSEQMQEKMKFFSKESAIDFTEIEEALILLKQRKETETVDMTFLNKVDEEKSRDLEKQMMVLQADYAETIEELEKTRNLLIVQHQINKDYQLEVEAVTKKLEENKQEHEVRLDEYAQLLDIRAARIRKLELQLRDIAYGTKQYKLHSVSAGDDDLGAGSDVEEIDETIHLERGENLFEIHIDKLLLSREALVALGDDEPLLFCTWEFFEHETQSTPVVKGPAAVFDFTSQYIVRVDDFFLHHLQKESTALEVHQAIGTEFRTIASCRLRFRDIFEKPHARVHGTIDILFDVTDESQQMARVQLGTLHFWVRLRVPMDQALRLYKERTKALGYISNNEGATTAPSRQQTDAPGTTSSDVVQSPAGLLAADGNINELQIKIFKAANIKSRQADVQPSAYCVYKFFDFPDHDTVIVPSSNAPVFNDLHVFPVVMAADLDSYLKSTSLEVFVFDDTDPELTAYLGMASVPLIALAHDKAIKGNFELKKADGSVNGTIEVFLKWQCTYLPPAAATRIPAQGSLAQKLSQPKDTLALMPGEKIQSVEGAQGRSAVRNVVVFEDKVGKSAVDHRSAAVISEEQKQPVQLQPWSGSPQGKRVKDVEPRSPIRKAKVPTRATDSEHSVNVKVKSAAAAAQPVQLIQAVKSKSSTKEVIPEITPEAKRPSPSSRLSLAQSSAVAQEPSAVGLKVIAAKEQQLPDANDTDGSLTVTSLSTDMTTSVHNAGSEANVEEEIADMTQSAGGQGFNTEVTTEIEEKLEEEEEEEAAAGAALAAAAAAADEASDVSSIEEEGDDQDTRLDDGTLDGGSEEIDLPNVGTRDSGATDEGPDVQSDSDGVVSPVPRRLLASTAKDNIVTISVNHLSIEEGSPLLSDGMVQRLFVAYTFLDFNPAELETPVSLPKPDHANRPLQYNFRRVFHVDAEANSERRQYLASMLLPNASDGGRIIFTVVSEPPEEDQSSECFDVGTASVSIVEIKKKKQDVIDTDIAVYDVQSESKVVIGYLNVTVECVAVLEAIEDEFDLGGPLLS